jgi:hypothetical protein
MVSGSPNMLRPRDENLRLIGAKQEAAHIQEMFSNARNMTVLFLALFILSCLLFQYSNGLYDTDSIWYHIGMFFGYFVPLSAVAIIYYGVKTLKYIWFGYRHRDFLRKHNRL